MTEPQQPTKAAVRVLLHTLGLRPELGKLTPYRNHYVAGPGHHSAAELAQLVDLGLMEIRRTPRLMPAGDSIYAATEAGKAFAVAFAGEHAPKLTRSQLRYRRWLECDCDLCFGDWLRKGA
jgi:hypothetical protein